jgi:hypothetical protein
VQDGFQKCSQVRIKCRDGFSFDFDFLEQYHKDCDEFPNHIVRVTGDETWVSFVNGESKGQSRQWMHTHSPNKLRKFKQKSARKLTATVFLDKKGVLMVEFMQQRTTIMSEAYCETLKKTA